MKLSSQSSNKKDFIPVWSYRTEIVAFCVMVSISAMYYYCLLSYAALAVLPTAFGATSATPQALNTTNTNLIPNGAGPVLYYNGTGPVTSYDDVSPDPVPITPINR